VLAAVQHGPWNIARIALHEDGTLAFLAQEDVNLKFCKSVKIPNTLKIYLSIGADLTFAVAGVDLVATVHTKLSFHDF
jgi:hypothetical protein